MGVANSCSSAPDRTLHGPLGIQILYSRAVSTTAREDKIRILVRPCNMYEINPRDLHYLWVYHGPT